MKYVKITLSPGDSVAHIMGIFSKIKTPKIIFICPRNYSLLSDITFLKKIQKTAQEQEKEIAFVSPQKFARDALKIQKISTYSTITKEIQEGSEKKIKDFYDSIKATKNIQQEKEIIKKLSHKSSQTPKFEMHKIEGERNEKPLRGKIFFGFLCIILILVAIWMWISPKAIISLKPKISIAPIMQNIMVVFPETELQPEDEFLPQIQGIFTQTEVTGTETFPSTGRRYDLTNARGKVTLFNETSKPKFLIPSRLSTVDGTIFRFSENVTIPPHDGQIPGRSAIDIVADEYDEDGNPIGNRGNIEAGTELFFPALREESRELYYARANKGPLVGGSTLTHYLLAEGDFEGIRETLISTFRVRGTEYLRDEIKNRSQREGKSYVLLDDPRLLKHELLEANFSDYLVGDEVQTFDVMAKLQLAGVVFDQTEVTQFLTKKLRQTQDHRKKLLHIDENSASYRVLDADHISLEKGQWVKLSVEMQGVEMLDIDSDSPDAREWQKTLKKEIAGKSISEAKNILTNYSEIDHVLDIKISPFWAEKLPEIFNQIEFEIQT
jgi:hypothetical protein